VSLLETLEEGARSAAHYSPQDTDGALRSRVAFLSGYLRDYPSAAAAMDLVLKGEQPAQKTGDEA